MVAVRHLPLVAFVLAVGVIAAGCDTSGSFSQRSAGDATSSSDDVQIGGDGSVGGDVRSIAIQPKMAHLTSKNGSKPTKDFDVVATLSDGTTGRYNGPIEFEIEDRSIGEIKPSSGEFTAAGLAGGTTEIRASIPDDSSIDAATAKVRVTVVRVIEGGNLPKGYEKKFGSPTTDAKLAPNVVYPLDGALMPQNVFPADIQWTRGAKGDLFKIELAKRNARITAYLKHGGAGFGNHWLVEQTAWRTLTRTDPTKPTKIRVIRYAASAKKAVRDASFRSIEFAKGSLTGSVYYWDISATRIKRIDDGTGKSVSFMPDPPNSRNGGANCVGCHSVSNDGRYMVGRLGPGDNIGAVFDLTKDLTKKPVPKEFPLKDNGPRWWFSTWKPDDSRLMVTQGPGDDQGLALMDPFSGKIIQPKAGSLPQSGVTHPAWAPDDSRVAFVTNAKKWGGELDQGDIATIPVKGKDRFGQPKTIRKASNIPNAHPSGDALAYPSWTPDAKWIAFAHGTGGRSERFKKSNMMSDESALYMMRRDGSDVVRLDNANGGPQTTNNFQPNFSPFDAGGYFWLSFLSRRPYGNSAVGTRGSSGRQQIWVTGIEKDPAAGQDPSRVAYWLPGQSVQSRNISAFWAPRACRKQGKKCSVDSECCSGECAANSNGKLTCSPPPPGECRKRGQTCSSDSDCCNPSLTQCKNSVCVPRGG